eukprot:4765386-Heterocapsa_arctica.AAC.1
MSSRSGNSSSVAEPASQARLQADWIARAPAGCSPQKRDGAHCGRGSRNVSGVGSAPFRAASRRPL